MTLVGTPTETLGYVVGTAIPTGAGAAETTILSTDTVQANANPNSGPASPQIMRPVIIECNLNVTPGTSTTAIVIKCRQGFGTGGTQVGASATVTLAAGASDSIQVKFRDFSGVPFATGGTPYTVTLTQTGGAAAGTVNTIDIEVKQ